MLAKLKLLKTPKGIDSVLMLSAMLIIWIGNYSNLDLTLADSMFDDARRHFSGMDNALAEHDLDGLTRMNQDFHRDLYGLNPDQAAQPLIESVWLQLGPFQLQVIEHLDDYANADHHKEMLAAMCDRDLPALCAAIENDIHDGSIRAGRRMLQEACA